MNKLQQIVSDISGYDPKENGARNDAYYECKTEIEQLGFLVDFVFFGTDDDKVITVNDIIHANKWLQRSFKNDNIRYQAFMELGVKDDNNN